MGWARMVDAASRAFTTLGVAPEGMPGRIRDELLPWIKHLVESAAVHWLPYLSSGRSCAVPTQAGSPLPCRRSAIAPCSACERPCCLQHAAVDQHGGAICYVCVGEIMRVHRARQGAPPPGPNADRQPHVPPDAQELRIKQALKVLGLKRGSSWAEIKQTHRKLSAKLHPDRQRNEAAKVRAEERFKAVQSAYLDLERFYPKEEVAA